MIDASKAIVHATCVALSGQGALLRGPSGSGKSDLALRFMFLPPLHGIGQAALIADDQVCVVPDADGCLMASCPPQIKGRIEIRGLGIVQAPVIASQAHIRLIVDLVDEEDMPRFPETPSAEEMLGVLVPRMLLSPFTAAAPLKLAMAIRMALCGSI